MVVDLQARVAVVFDGWAKGMVAEGRSRELRDSLVHVVGEEHADTRVSGPGGTGAGTGTAGTAVIDRQAGAAGASAVDDRNVDSRLRGNDEITGWMSQDRKRWV